MSSNSDSFQSIPMIVNIQERDTKAYASDSQNDNPWKNSFCFYHSAASTIVTSALSKPASVCQNLVESMPRRIQAVLQAKGGYIKY